MKRIITSLLVLGLLLTNTPVFGAAVFTDVTSDHPNYDAINYLYEKSIVEGYADNSFRPNQLVNRAEALKIILLGSKVDVPQINAQEIFPDVLHNAWYGRFVRKAKTLAIVKGDDGTGLFRPGDTVNLAEALKILLETTKTERRSPSTNPYRDVPSDAWFAPYFEYARLAGLLDQQSVQNVNPATAVTRGLLAELMYRHATKEVIIPDGKASYYGEKFHGRTTANGEIFDASALTAAHRTYAFDTWLKVTNVANGESVKVRVNDRGPYAGENRVIDLSKAAFESISPLSRGIIEVRLEPTSPPTDEPNDSDNDSETSLTNLIKGDLLNSTKSSCPELRNLSFISKNAFEQITLDNELPNHFIQDDVLTISGTATGNAKRASAFLIDEDENQTAYYGALKNGRFTIHVRFPDTGVYQLGLLPAEAGTSTVRDVRVSKNTCIEEVESIGLTAPTGLELDVEEGDTVVSWNDDEYNVYKLTFSQGGLHNSYILHNTTEWRPIYKEFERFVTGDFDVSLRGANVTKAALVEPVQIVWSPAVTKTFLASHHHEYNVNHDDVELTSLTKNVIIGNNLKAVFKANIPVRTEAALILPTGKVEEIELTGSSQSPEENAFGIEVFPASNNSLTARYKAVQTGIHFLEINNAEGLAVINVPIYIRNQFPLIPTDRDLANRSPVDLGDNLNLLRGIMLGLVNEDRLDANLPKLTLDSNLNNLAQSRSNDMVENQYFGHWDREGRDANDLRANFGIQPLVGENLAKDLNLELAEYGLMRSAIHRSNILSDEWTRVGFGITKDTDGSYIVVQIFSSDALDLDDLDQLRSSVLNSINKNRGNNLTATSTLNDVAQAWSVDMADDDFFDFTAPNGTELVTTVRDAGINAALGTFIMGNSSFADALESLEDNEQLQESKWKNVGIGIKQDNVGIIKITLIYTE